MLLEFYHQRLLSNGALFKSFLLNSLVSPSRRKETLFEPFVFSLFCKVFMYFFESQSCRLMADITLLTITGWTVLYILLNNTCDKNYKENNLSRFPFQENKVNEWFQEQASRGDHTTGRINTLNLRKRPGSNEYPRLNEAVFPPSGEEVEGFTMLYHGTRHEYAKSILQGIKLESDDYNDFSCGKGFYVTNQFERAVSKYAFSRSAKAAVLVFKIPNDVLESYRKRSLNLVGEEKKKEWRHAVVNIRDIAKKNKYSFIEGPEMKRKRRRKKTYRQIQDTHQICILDEEMAETFDKHLDSVVFYNTSRR